MARRADANDIGCGGQAALGTEQNRGAACCGAHSASARIGYICHRSVEHQQYCQHRYLGIEVDDAIQIAEKTDICMSTR